MAALFIFSDCPLNLKGTYDEGKNQYPNLLLNKKGGRGKEGTLLHTLTNYYRHKAKIRYEKLQKSSLSCYKAVSFVFTSSNFSL